MGLSCSKCSKHTDNDTPEDSIYTNIPSKIFEIPGFSPDYYSEKDKKDFISGHKKSYWINLYIREDKIKDGKLNQTPHTLW